MGSRKERGEEKIEATGLPAIDFPGRGLTPAEKLASEKGPREFILFRKIQGALRNIPDFPETCKAILDAVMDELAAENCSISPGFGPGKGASAFSRASTI
jgi:hypothetical protein